MSFVVSKSVTIANPHTSCSRGSITSRCVCFCKTFVRSQLTWQSVLNERFSRDQKSWVSPQKRVSVCSWPLCQIAPSLPLLHHSPFTDSSFTCFLLRVFKMPKGGEIGYFLWYVLNLLHRIESKHEVTILGGLNEFIVKFYGPNGSKWRSCGFDRPIESSDMTQWRLAGVLGVLSHIIFVSRGGQSFLFV